MLSSSRSCPAKSYKFAVKLKMAAVKIIHMREMRTEAAGKYATPWACLARSVMAVPVESSSMPHHSDYQWRTCGTTNLAKKSRNSHRTAQIK